MTITDRKNVENPIHEKTFIRLIRLEIVKLLKNHDIKLNDQITCWMAGDILAKAYLNMQSATDWAQFIKLCKKLVHSFINTWLNKQLGNCYE